MVAGLPTRVAPFSSPEVLFGFCSGRGISANNKHTQIMIAFRLKNYKIYILKALQEHKTSEDTGQ